ncbi:TetR/AcrR family transcriptional regulator [Gorillibacterium sp. sgz5001074]|uniref:TetR/AcrR family transcriptional regulator n=1 Tax=Gorillibacterium sp. sgz5001074 TaxID=3446695 RepID=UPI003F66D74A
MSNLNLRDMKKAATAQALAQAAFELTLERGFDGFIVEDVVQRAGYSRRTFANHYSCKEEAVAMAAIPPDLEDILSFLDEFPEDELPLDFLHRLIRLPSIIHILVRMRQLMQLAKEHPTLEPYILIGFRRMQSDFQSVLNSLFQERYPPVYTHLLAGAVIEAFLPILDGGVHVQLPGQPPSDGSPSVTYDEYLGSIFHYLRNGF